MTEGKVDNELIVRLEAQLQHGDKSRIARALRKHRNHVNNVFDTSKNYYDQEVIDLAQRIVLVRAESTNLKNNQLVAALTSLEQAAQFQNSAHS